MFYFMVYDSSIPPPGSKETKHPEAVGLIKVPEDKLVLFVEKRIGIKWFYRPIHPENFDLLIAFESLELLDWENFLHAEFNTKQAGSIQAPRNTDEST